MATAGDTATIRARVRLALLETGRTQTDLAREMGISRQRVSAALRQHARLSVETVRQFALALGTCAGELSRPLTEEEWARLGRAS